MTEQKEVLEAAVSTISYTMDAGQAANGVGSFWNKDNLYHLKKAMHHILDAWHEQDVNSREKEDGGLIHIDNAMTRLAMIKAKLKREQLRGVGLVMPVPEHGE